jgi:hypothetical protein
LVVGRLTGEEARRYIGPYFTSGGRVNLNLARHAVDAVATELGIPAATVAAATVDPMYLPALCPSRYVLSASSLPSTSARRTRLAGLLSGNRSGWKTTRWRSGSKPR